jgi:sulfur-oxidizing protein SoxX
VIPSSARTALAAFALLMSANIKTKYPDRNDLLAIVNDETRRNPQTVMPPFGRNRILTEKEINAIVDFLQTL